MVKVTARHYRTVDDNFLTEDFVNFYCSLVLVYNSEAAGLGVRENINGNIHDHRFHDPWRYLTQHLRLAGTGCVLFTVSNTENDQTHYNN